MLNVSMFAKPHDEDDFKRRKCSLKRKRKICKPSKLLRSQILQFLKIFINFYLYINFKYNIALAFNSSV